MKKTLIAILLTMVCLPLTGCIVAIGNKGPKEPPHCTTKHIQQDPVCTEIFAVKKLMNQSAKERVYMAIAKRPGLKANQRACLATEASNNLINDAAKERVLLALANNYTKPQPKNEEHPMPTGAIVGGVVVDK